MHKLTVRGLFTGLASNDPHGILDKHRVVCERCVGRSYCDLDVIGLQVFPPSLTGDGDAWFNELIYKSIYTWEQLTDVSEILSSVEEAEPKG